MEEQFEEKENPVTCPACHGLGYITPIVDFTLYPVPIPLIRIPWSVKGLIMRPVLAFPPPSRIRAKYMICPLCSGEQAIEESQATDWQETFNEVVSRMGYVIDPKTGIWQKIPPYFRGLTNNEK